MKITIIAENPKKKNSLNKLVDIFKKIKSEHNDLEINLRLANRISGMNRIDITDNECLIVFGSSLYTYLLKDINEFDRLTSSTSRRDVHKFSYFIRNNNKHYFLACMPPIDFTILKPETFLAFESFMTNLKNETENFKISIRDIFLKKEKPERKEWRISIIENGFSPITHAYFKYDEIKFYLYSLFNKPDWHEMAIDTETMGLEIWNAAKHDIKIASFSDEENVGHAINLGLPGLISCLTPEQLKEVESLFVKYIFEKPKIFIAWFCNYDIFTICNKYKKTYRDFLRTNKIIDGIQLLHAFSENRKIEGYGIKACSRDFLNYAQYSYIEKYIDYIYNWENYTVKQIIETANNSMKYAAEDAAGEYTLTTKIFKEIKKDPIVSNFADRIANKIMAIKLEIEWNGLNVDLEGMSKNSDKFSGWEIKNIVEHTIKKCKSSTDRKLHSDLFVFSTTTGRLLYGKPYLNSMKIGSEVSKYFIPEKGRTFVYIDLDSADLRSAALVSQDKRLIDDLNNGKDYYMNFSKTLFGETAGALERNKTKKFVLSMLNLASENTVAKDIGKNTYDAKTYINQFYDSYPRMLEYKNKVIEFLRKNSFVMSASFRKRRFSEDDLSNKFFWTSFLSAHNFAFQATTSDLMILNCFSFLAETRSYDVKQVYLNVDAAIFEVPDEYLDEIRIKANIFKEIPGIICNGTLALQEIMLGKKPNINSSLKMPVYTYKIYKGKNMKEWEDF